MSFGELVLRTRSYRRFDASVPIDMETLRQLIELARCVPSAANRQPLKYILSCQPEWNAKIFKSLGWAGYLPDWPGPIEAERPTAYVIILTDKTISESSSMDIGIAAQTILLGAVEKGLGGCMFGSIRRSELAGLLGLAGSLEIGLVLALGKPVEEVVLEDVGTDGSIKYYRDADQNHHVPKRKLDALIYKAYA